MFKVFSADPLPRPDFFLCPWCKLNFISLLSMAPYADAEKTGPLSVKYSFSGEEVYEIGGRRLTVEPGRYLILNDQQRYASSVEQPRAVDSFCVWFRPGFAETVLQTLMTPHDRLLDDPAMSNRQPVVFHDRVMADDDVVTPILQRMGSALQAGTVSREWLEEQFHMLLAGMLEVHRRAYPAIERIPAARPSTRAELYRRLNHAKDYLDSCLDVPVSLTEVANVACMGPHHCLRMFKKVYGETPHQYHVRQRLERAQRLLRSTDHSVTRICQEVGFESLGSFSWLFRRQFGLPPTAFRAEASTEVVD